jgi:hypothetical protein
VDAASGTLEPVTLHSSWRSVAGGYVGPAVLLAVVAFASIRGGIGPVAVAVGGVGMVILVVLLLDFPVATRFDAEGVERRMPLRRHRLGWGDVRLLTRTSGRLLSPARFSSSPDQRLNRGGLVAVVGRRRYLLVDQVESRDEFVRLQRLLEQVAPELVDDTLSPPADVAPTFLYRRRRWRPGVD